MKKYFNIAAGIFLVSTASLSAASTKAVAVETNAAPAEPTVRKSVFQDDLKNGKDPFFPKSTRRAERLPNSTNAAPVIELALKGISGPVNRRFALINNQPIGVGETANVKIPGGQVKVHCWEIRDNSVLVSVEGSSEKKELRLRDSL
jgi:hypothetical protein